MRAGYSDSANAHAMSLEVTLPYFRYTVRVIVCVYRIRATLRKQSWPLDEFSSSRSQARNTVYGIRGLFNSTA
jgi:hypothetical protein